MSDQSPSQQVATPALLLMITGAIGALLALVSMGGSLVGGPQTLDPALLEGMDPAQAEQFMQIFNAMQGGGIFMNIINIAVSGFIFYGGLQMKDLKGYGLSMGAAIVAIIPCFACCCIGLPAGIWALVVLMRDDVKAAFQ